MSYLQELSPQNKLELARQRAALVRQQKAQILSSLPASAWIEKYFWVPELKGPVVLAPYQKAVLDYALTPDESGHFRFSTIVWSDIKKSIKSTIAAAVGLWMSYQKPWSSVYAIANDLKQADSRVGYYARRAIELSPIMKPTVRQKGYRLEFPNHSFFESIPIDPSGEAGSNADMIIFSELWGAHEDASQRMWTEMTLSPTKFGQSFRWVETYAGYLGESELLYRLYLLGTKYGEWVDLGFRPRLPLFQNLEARTLVLWNDAPRLPWQTPDYYKQEEAVLHPSEFARVHRNQWVSAAQSFVPIEWWKACHWQALGEPEFPKPTNKTPMIFAVDAGFANDYFAIVGVFKYKTYIVPWYVRRWIPPRNAKLDFSEPEAEIRRLASEYNVIQWAYDEFQLHDMATRLRRDGVGWFRVFSQQSLRAIADKLLYDSIASRQIMHAGQPELDEAIYNADAKAEGDKRLRLVKRSSHLHIDAAVALSMANHEAKRLNLE